MSAYTNNNSRIARPSSMVLTSSIHIPITSQNGRRSKIIDYNKKAKRPSSRLSKSHSMHRLDYHSDDEDEDCSYLLNQSEMKRRTLLSRATTTPYVPKPSSLIKRFSDHSNSGVLTSTKMSNTTEMRRSASLMNPQQQQQDGGDLVANFRLGQRVTVPSLSVVGTLRFFGETKFKDKGSIWVGIELDIKGSGKNDGSVQGVRYFSCPPETGLFVLASKVIVLEEYNHCRKITPRISKTTTTATAKKSNSSTTETTKRKSMIITTTTNTLSSSRTTTTPKKNRSMTTNTIKPSKSARSSSSTRSNQPLPTRSSPFETKKPATKASKPPLKKSSSLSTSTLSHDACQHHRSTPPKRSVRANTLPNTADDELKRIQTLLEQSRQEQRALAQQMDGKEAAWEKLVSVKESYAVRVQEKDDEIVRLKRLLEQAQPAHEQLAKSTGERDAALSRAKMSEAMEKQHSKVIERLDARVHDLQQKLVDQSSLQESQIRDHVAQMDQLRKQLAERDESTATIERECAELRRANVDTMRAFEQSMKQLQEQHEVEQRRKDSLIMRLEQMVNDFQQIYPTTPITPIDEDENSPRRRLEAQLELTTLELDREREIIKSQALDIEQLKDEIKRLHRVSVCSSSQFYSLRTELETEIEDKRRIMEEANNAIESQARMEDENERLKLTLQKTQHDLADVLRKLATMEKTPNNDLASKYKALEIENERLQTVQRQTEHECLRLMDELLAIEKVESHDKDIQQPLDEKSYRREIEQLKLQVAREAKRYQDLETVNQEKVRRLQKELSDLESLVENKVFNETELEEAIECEKRKVQALETRLREEEERNKKRHSIPLSPTSPQFRRHQTRSSLTNSTVSDVGNLLESAYCEICEEYGHDVMTCNAFKQESTYCVNCDVFDTHPTEECPNQDETF